MLRWWLVFVLVACKSSDSSSKSAPATTGTAPVPTDRAAPKPPDEMDEKMRHCPVALDGAVSTFEDIDGGVRFTITAPEASIAEARRRAHHIVDFAARKTRQGHGEFDGKGGGRMRNCPVVTDDVTITATDIEGGARVDVIAASDVAALRAETRARAIRFPFVGATVTAKP